MQPLDNMPALVYTALWPAKVDGRFKAVFPYENFTVLFNFIDFSPAALLKVHNGDFEVLPINPSEIAEYKADAKVEGLLSVVIRMMDGIGTIIKVVLTRKLKVKNLSILLKLGKLFLLKKMPEGGSK
jgi:hypothetical protein